MLVTAGKVDYVVASEERRHVQERFVVLSPVSSLPSWGTGQGTCQLLVFLGDRGFLRLARELLVASLLARKSSKCVPIVDRHCSVMIANTGEPADQSSFIHIQRDMALFGRSRGHSPRLLRTAAGSAQIVMRKRCLLT